MDNSALKLRSAKLGDAKTIWEIVNDRVVRSVSFLTDPIPWNDHLDWFTKQLNNEDVVHYVLLKENMEVVGNVRFAIEGSLARISIALASSVRGKGASSEVIRMGCKELFSSRAVSSVEALIRPTNPASIKAFVRAGFEKRSDTLAQGEKALVYILDRSVMSEVQVQVQ